MFENPRRGWQARNFIACVASVSNRVIVPSPSPVIHFFCSCPSFLDEPREETLATQARNFTTNVPKIIDLKSSSENWRCVCPCFFDYFAPLPTIWTPGTAGYTKSAHTKMLCVFFSCLSVGAIFERNFRGLILFKGWDLKSSSRKAKGFENSRILSNLEEVRLKLNARYSQEEV